MKKIVWFIVLIPLVVFAFIENTEVIKEYYENGNIKKSTSYRFNQKNGVEKEYYLNGNISSETEYKNGKRDGIEKYYNKNGKITTEAFYLDDKLDGIDKYYFDNGNLEREVLYSNGKLSGMMKMYYKDGKLKYKVPVSDDDEMFEMYNNKGILIVNMPFGKYLDEKAKSINDTQNIKQVDIKQLFNACAVCHGQDGLSSALGKSKIIAGQSSEMLYKSLIKYQSYAKDDAGYGVIMTRQLERLSDNQLKQLALYISQMPKQPN